MLELFQPVQQDAQSLANKPFVKKSEVYDAFCKRNCNRDFEYDKNLMYVMRKRSGSPLTLFLHTVILGAC